MKTATATKFVRVHFSLGYIVPADREDMIEQAINAVQDDLLLLMRENELHVSIDDAKDATAEDVPEFIRELCGDLDEGIVSSRCDTL